jgi:hypothetical protein
MLITNLSLAGEVTPKGNSPKGIDNFPSYLVTPYKSDTNSDFEKALVVPEAPGRSVCQSLLHFKESRKGYDSGKIYRDMPCTRHGYTVVDVLIFVGGALTIGYFVGVASTR